MNSVVSRVLTQREFLKLCGLAIVGAGAARMVIPPKSALAVEYDTLTVTGNTYLATAGGDVGIGTSSPASRLHLAGGAIRIGSRVIVDSNGFYYGQ